jgi:hypothetical protein
MQQAQQSQQAGLVPLVPRRPAAGPVIVVKQKKK